MVLHLLLNYAKKERRQDKIEKALFWIAIFIATKTYIVGTQLLARQGDSQIVTSSSLMPLEN